MDEASKRSVLLVAALAYATLVACVVVVAAILLVVAETWQGHVYAVAGLCLLALPPLAVWARLRKGRARTAAAGVALLVGALVAALYAASPDGRPLPGSPLRSEFLGGAGYRRASVAALLPEIDQIKLGTYVMSVLDPLIDRHEAAHLRELCMRSYRAMEREPEWVALGTALPDAYADRDAGQLYAYAPPHDPGERLPAILFLHGSAGSFKAYFYLWRRYADRAHAAVVLPSFGWGNWYQPGGVEAIERVRAWAVATLGVDEKRIFLVGLSNGGTGVTRAAAANPGAYCGLGFVSPVLEDEILRGSKQSPRAMPWPMLVVHGTIDDRIPVEGVAGSVARLRAQGATVDYRPVENEDHFLFFSRDEEVLGDVEAWTKEVATKDCRAQR
jgi:pimeloyl-ACP methyl ester carboxylesterase